MVDIDDLERLLINAATEKRTLAYGDVLRHFDKRTTPIRVYALCRDLGKVSDRNRERGEPELAVLVVRKSDRLPGEGFFHGPWEEGHYDGPATGPRAVAYIEGLTQSVFDYWDTGPN
ncbi:MAG: ribose-phosphate pyrophosphokinase [Geminicoccales bacterium]